MLLKSPIILAILFLLTYKIILSVVPGIVGYSSVAGKITSKIILKDRYTLIEQSKQIYFSILL